MCTYSGLGGWQPLTAPLNPAFMDPFDAPHIQGKGCQMGGDGYLQSLGDSQGGGLQHESKPLSHRSRGSGFNSFELLRGPLGYSGGRGWQHLLGGDGAEDTEECDTAPLRSPYKPSAANPATASCTCGSPSASNWCASSHSILAHLSKSSPRKREKGSVTKARTVRKAMQYQAKRHTWLNIPCASSSVNTLLLLSLWPLPFMMTHLQMKQPQMSKGDWAGRSGKQMFDLMDQLLKKEGNSYSSETVWQEKRER